jgi:hypothetical protein
MTPSSAAPEQRQVFGTLVFALGALCLLIHLAGVGRLAYDVVIIGAAANLLVKLVILGLVFLFGLGLGVLSQRRFENAAFALFARVYTWVYLAMVWVTYLGVTLQVNRQAYSFLQYSALFLILVAQLVSAFSLRLVIPDRAYGLFAIPMLAIVLFHLLLIVYRYVFVSQPVTAYLAGDLFLLVVMTVVSSAMLGQNAFRAVMDRVIEKVG